MIFWTILEIGIPAALIYWLFGPLGLWLWLGVPLIFYVVMLVRANRR